MPESTYRPNAFDRFVVFLAAERARPVAAIARPRTLCPDKSNK